METPDTLLYVAGGAFLLGWLIGKIGAYFGNRFAARKRDPRDDRIRNLDAELRIAQIDSEKSKEKVVTLEAQLREEVACTEARDTVIADLNKVLDGVRSDLKDSVLKTRELRSELSNRAEENLKSEVKLREVETELSVAQASTDMIATGVLDYAIAPEGGYSLVAEDDEDEPPGRVTAIT